MGESLTILLTGANSGIGLACTLRLVELGHEVIATVRDDEKGKFVIEKATTAARQQGVDPKISYMIMDTGNMESIRKFIEEFKRLGTKLDVLINNAGVMTGMQKGEKETVSGNDNLEICMMVNCMGPFLLTNSLLDNLKATARERGKPSRIVNVSSCLTVKLWGQKVPMLDLDDLMLVKEYVNGLHAYRNSKCSLNLWSNELAKKLRQEEITINTVCPGFIPATNLTRFLGPLGKIGLWVLDNPLGRWIIGMTTIDTGIECILEMVFNEQINTSGTFYMHKQPQQEAAEVLDSDNQKKIWKLCEQYTGLTVL